MSKLTEIKDLKAADARKLAKAGIRSQEALYQQCRTPKARQHVARQVKISSAKLFRWANHAAFTRIKGLGEKYARLLESCGIRQASQLARFAAKNLHQKMLSKNRTRHMVKALPSTRQVSRWIQQAKRLPKIVR